MTNLNAKVNSGKDKMIREITNYGLVGATMGLLSHICVLGYGVSLPVQENLMNIACFQLSGPLLALGGRLVDKVSTIVALNLDSARVETRPDSASRPSFFETMAFTKEEIELVLSSAIIPYIGHGIFTAGLRTAVHNLTV